MDQPELGVSNVGVDTVSVSLSWRWESGWRFHYSQRLSGSDAWTEIARQGRSAEDVHQEVCDVLAVALGLA